MANPDTFTPATLLVAAAETAVVVHAAALRPLMQIGAHTPDNPPTLEAALAAVLHLHAAGPGLDDAMTDVLRALTHSVTEAKLARMLGVRRSALAARLSAPSTIAAAVPAIEPTHFTPRDRVSVRCARETLPTAAAEVGAAYATALRPLSHVSQGDIPAAATIDATLEAVVHLNSSRSALNSSLDGVLALLVLGGVGRMALARDLLGVAPSTLQRRLMGHPFSHARGVDLANTGSGWTVQRAEIGRYAQ